MSAQAVQKQISISITKIFNWPEAQNNCIFELIFYPEDSQISIIEKIISGIFLSNSMNLNAPLKITYTDDQNIIILKMNKICQNNRKQLLGEFQLDLDALRIKNVQYFPFGKDFVLQINLYTPPKANSRTSRAESFLTNYNLGRNSKQQYQGRHDQYRYDKYERYPLQGQRQRQGYQRKSGFSRVALNHNNKYDHNYRTMNDNAFQSRLKKSFSEKVYTLLQQVKQMKQQIIVGANKKGYQSKEINMQYYPQNRIKKSMSDGKFQSYGSIGSATSSSGFRRQEKKEEPIKQQKNQKHRLILSTLNVVPCDEYYKNQSQKPSYKRQQYRQSNEIKNNNGGIGIRSNYYPTKVN